MDRLSVVKAFIARKPAAANGNIISSGTELFSYNMLIAKWVSNICYLVNNNEAPSKTTTIHINAVAAHVPTKMLCRVTAAEIKEDWK